MDLCLPVGGGAAGHKGDIQHLVENHPEIEKVRLWCEDQLEIDSSVVQPLLQLGGLVSLVFKNLSIRWSRGGFQDLPACQVQDLGFHHCCLSTNHLSSLLGAFRDSLQSLYIIESLFCSGQDLLIGHLPPIRALNLSMCEHLTDSRLRGILKMCGENLHNLQLTGLDLAGAIPIFQGLSLPIQILDLSWCLKLTNEGLLEVLNSCRTTLRSIDLESTDITGENLASISLPMLNSLSLSMCDNLNDEGLSTLLSRCGSRLRNLNLTGTKISGEPLSHYQRLLPTRLNIEMLNISWCKKLTTLGLSGLLRHLQHSLTSLTLSASNITGEQMSRFVSSLPSLENLDLSNCKNLSNSGLRDILGLVGSKLQDLDLSDTNISGESLSRLTKPLDQVRQINLSNCKLLTDIGLRELVRVCGANLEVLKLNETLVSGEGVSHLNTQLAKLHTLHMLICKNLTDKGLCELLQLCGSGLQNLDIGSTNITLEQENIKFSLPIIESLSLSVCKNLKDKGRTHINYFNNLKNEQ